MKKMIIFKCYRSHFGSSGELLANYHGGNVLGGDSRARGARGEGVVLGRRRGVCQQAEPAHEDLQKGGYDLHRGGHHKLRPVQGEALETRLRRRVERGRDKSG